MDIFLKVCISQNGFVTDYTIHRGSELVGFLCWCNSTHRWKIRVRDETPMSLVEVGAAWSLLINRLGLEKT